MILLDWPSIQEWESIEIPLKAPKSLWDQLECRVNAQTTLPLMIAGPALLSIHWPPSGAGLYEVTVWNASQLIYSESVWVAPRLFSTDALFNILEQLHQQLPLSLAVRLKGQAKIPIVWKSSSEKTWEQGLMQIKQVWLGDHYFPGIKELLKAYPQSYPLQFSIETKWESLRKAKYIPLATWQRLLISPGQEKEMIQIRKPSPDHHFHRHMAVYLLIFFNSLTFFRLMARLKHSPESEWIKSIQGQLSSELKRTQLHKFPKPQAPIKQVFHPLHQAWIHWFQQIKFAPHPQFYESQGNGFLLQTPLIYQYWLTLQILESFKAWAETSTGKWLTFAPTQRDFHFHKLTRGETPWAVREHNDIKWVFYVEKPFSVHGQIQSSKFKQIPDISILTLHNHIPHSLMIFEVKYKKSQKDDIEKEDLDKIHAYRDSLRFKGKPIVKKAILLYPGKTQILGSEIAAIQSHPDHRDKLLKELKTHCWQNLTLTSPLCTN